MIWLILYAINKPTVKYLTTVSECFIFPLCMNTFNFLYTYAKRQWPTLLITMIVVLENSRIVQSGTHEELIEAEGRYRMLSTAAG